jgi:diguanylate cyclase (GGDEF)-like protein
VGLVYIDLDGFKQVNDRSGHAAGDALLVAVARRLTRVLRERDTLARIGGDEFVIACEGLPAGDSEAQTALDTVEARCPVDPRGRWRGGP